MIIRTMTKLVQTGTALARKGATSNPMKKTLALVLSILGLNAALFAQSTTAPAAPTAPTPPTSRPAMPTLPKIALPADLQNLIKQFDAQRDAFLAQRKADLDKLKNATEAERAKLLADMKAKGMELSAEQRELARNIREELKKLRAARKTGGS